MFTNGVDTCLPLCPFLFSGLLLLIQTALVYGIFGAAAVYVTRSSADLWVGHTGTQSFDLGRAIPRDTEIKMLMDPGVERIEPFQWLGGDWHGLVGKGTVSVFISGIDPRSDGMMFDHALRPALRQRLYEPGSIIVDRNDLSKLGLDSSDYGLLNGHRVHLVGTAKGLGALGGVNVLTSLTTARWLSDITSDDERVTYYGIKLRHPGALSPVIHRLRSAGKPWVDVWTRQELARKTMVYWLFETGAGLGILFLTVIILMVGIAITSQTLMATVSSCLREYATLQALGVGFRELRKVVLEQAAWIGGLGIVFGSALGGAILIVAREQGVPVRINTTMALVLIVLVMMIAQISGVLAVRTLRHADPARLLR